MYIMGEPDLEEIGLPSECPYCNENDFVFSFKSEDVRDVEGEQIGICEGFDCNACGEGFIFFTQQREFLAPVTEDEAVEYLCANTNYDWAIVGSDDIGADGRSFV